MQHAHPLAPYFDERAAITGRSGTGKTYAARGGVECALDSLMRVCVIDPLDVWWGLRSERDGSPGRLRQSPIIFGGAHADIEITEDSGEIVGRAIANSLQSSIVSLADLGSDSAMRRFCSAFLGALYAENREPLLLVVDEADMLAPQRPMPGFERLLGHMQNIVRRGRVRGFVPWLITQRPAVLNKDVLSQADVLVAMNLTSSQDRDAIGGWIEGQADKAEAKKLLASLPKLPRGSGFVWAPKTDRLERVDFPAIATFDSSRTPKRGEARQSVRLGPIDVDSIKGQLADLAAAKAKGKAAATGVAPANAQTEAALNEIADEAYRRGVAVGREEAEAAQRAAEARLVEWARWYFNGGLEQLVARSPWGGGVGAIDLAGPPGSIQSAKPPNAPVSGPSTLVSGFSPPIPPALKPAPYEAPNAPQTGKGNGAHLRILRVLAQRHPARLTRAQWAVLARMKRTGGTWTAYLSRLRNAGHLDESGGLFSCTPSGLRAAGAVGAQPQTPAEVLAMWRGALGGGERKMLDALVELYPRWTDRANLGDRLRLTVGGGTFTAYMSRLRSNGLIEENKRMVRAAPTLMGG